MLRPVAVVCMAKVSPTLRSDGFGPPLPSSTPTGVAVFARDIAQPVRRTAERDNRIVHWSEFDHGGHLAATEQPEQLVAEIRAFFRLLGSPRRVQ
jgi:microsomal epoxide hydrolase